MMEKNNTKISYFYRYRDESGHTVKIEKIEAIISGRISYTQVRTILRSRFYDEFIPSMVGLPGYNDENDDLAFHDVDGFAREIFSYTDKPVTVNLTPEELAKRFEYSSSICWGW